MLLLSESRDRLAQWGRVFGGAAPGHVGGGGGAQAVAPVRTGRRIGAVALGLALVAPVALLRPWAAGCWGPAATAQAAAPAAGRSRR